MKKHIATYRCALTTCAMATLLSTASVLASDSFIKQFELDSNGNPVVISTIVFNGPAPNSESSGQDTSAKNIISENSPYYELWTTGMGSDSGTWYLLDTASTGPTTYITLVSGDFHEAGQVGGATYRPFSPIRTRADQPYGIIMQSQLTLNQQEEGGVEASGKIDMENVYFRSTTLSYDEETNTKGNNVEVFESSSATEKIFNISELSNTSDSQYELYRDAGVSSLPIEDEINFKQRGQDIYRVYALSNSGMVIAPLTQEKMQIWPIAEGSIELIGYKPYETITRSLPEIKITLKDLYPYSTTYALIYKGTKAVPLVTVESPAKVIEISRRSVPMDNMVPQSQEYTISADDWKDYVPDDCEYTIEIVTHTPFEGLDYPSTTPEAPITLTTAQAAQVLPILEPDPRTSALILSSDKMPASGGLSLFYTSFTVDRTISVKANVITSE